MKRFFLKNGTGNFLQIMKYYAVGAFVNIGGYGIFLFWLHLGMGPKLAASLLYLVGALVSFWLNRALVFDSSVSVQSGLARLLLMLLMGYVLNIGTLYICVDKYGLNPSFVQLFSVVYISIIFYLVNKFFVHRTNYPLKNHPDHKGKML